MVKVVDDLFRLYTPESKKTRVLLFLFVAPHLLATAFLALTISNFHWVLLSLFFIFLGLASRSNLRGEKVMQDRHILVRNKVEQYLEENDLMDSRKMDIVLSYFQEKAQQAQKTRFLFISVFVVLAFPLYLKVINHFDWPTAFAVFFVALVICYPVAYLEKTLLLILNSESQRYMELSMIIREISISS